MTSMGFCLVQGRTGFGIFMVVKTRTIESSGLAAGAATAPALRTSRPIETWALNIGVSSGDECRDF